MDEPRRPGDHRRAECGAAGVSAMSTARQLHLGIAAFLTTVLTILVQAAAAGTAPFA